MKIFVKNNDISRALRVLKKKLYEEGDTKELRERQHFIPAGVQRRIEKRAGERRWAKKREQIEQNRIRAEAAAFNKRRKKQQPK